MDESLQHGRVSLIRIFSGSMSRCTRKMLKSPYTAGCGVDAILILSTGIVFVTSRRHDGDVSIEEFTVLQNRIVSCEKCFSGIFHHCLLGLGQVTLGPATFGLNLLLNGSTNLARRHFQKGLPQ
ncbi:hypothetical protein [Tunturibacter empetritectus]|uniref:Uncharacterized protein n=1 Tax=Tunturiibacter lichenicola TaxID=2051959 RepID=A0A7W8JAZ5_9BACT|nr:hypothetical protein [Edaphobacter lichenicola]MBB5345850.1 hypothetical protein [Edaphobacter lichenicola]